MEEIEIRELRSEDEDAVRGVDITTQRQYLGNKWDEMNEEEQEAHLVLKRSEFLVNIGTGFGFVAESGGRIVGFVLAHETLPFRGSVYIRHIAIVPGFQGREIGGKLLEAVIEKAKSMGMKKVWSMINTDNPRSMKMHEKVGFKLRDRKEAVYEIG